MLMISSIKISSFSSQRQQKSNVSRKYYSAKNNSLNSDVVSFKARPLQVLQNEYNTLIKTKGLNPVKAFFSISDEQSAMDGLLTSILKSEDSAFEFIADAVKNPRETLKFANALPDKVGPNSDNVMTFFYTSPYAVAYKGFITKKFDEAKSVGELLAIRPDWRGAKLLEKHKKLYGDVGFELGSIPKDLPKDDLMNIAGYLKGFMQGGGAKTPTKIDGINLNNGRYEFEYFTDGKTNKNVFGLNLPNGKKYILKMADENAKSLDDPFALGTLAKIDTYMTANKSRNTAPLLYYNHDKNFLIYEFVEHAPVDGDTRNLSVINSHIPDYKDLGLQFNDSVGSNNCFLLTEKSNSKLNSSVDFAQGVEKGEWVSVDNDHVTYSNNLHPQVREFHSYLPNGMQFCV